ncbi:thiamine-phosphate kinase [Pantoea sp. Aalb]|uniref:thiamine-phosphate kinase n=1 Tax=Pantoea sp. Aalb TaxID=2576762 RepID=UPI00132C15FF|nr:thiamine-phosphate kinase [Pantoea sp. Aalb]MXP67585.1 thiamine-phosphate kinase [Pantoea sp. Aalb]
MSCSEFQIIERYFHRTTNTNNNFKYNIETGIGDDCALLNIPENNTLVISTDTMVEGTHFFQDINPADLSYKALAVNLSDLAAMGAEPVWITLSLTLPEVNEHWLASFSNSLFNLLDYYKIQLIGGDTTCGPLSITISIYGLIPVGHAIKRSGAKLGDWIFVTGTLGDSAAGLSLLQQKNNFKNQSIRKILINRHLRPTPRILQGQALRNIANSAIDISDGLLSNIRHILNASHVGARINLESLPLSSILQNNFDLQHILNWALSGGEDYELCFTVPKINRKKLDLSMSNFTIPYTCIGYITSKSNGLTIFNNGKLVNSNYKEFDHFYSK